MDEGEEDIKAKFGRWGREAAVALDDKHWWSLLHLSHTVTGPVDRMRHWLEKAEVTDTDGSPWKCVAWMCEQHALVFQRVCHLLLDENDHEWSTLWSLSTQ